MSDSFLGAGDTRQLIIRAEREREKKLASLFYKTAGGPPQQPRQHNRRRTTGGNATKAGGQPFAGVRQQRRKQRRTKTSKTSNHSRSLMVSKNSRRSKAQPQPTHLSQSLPVLTEHGGSGITSTGSALDDFAEAALAADSTATPLVERAWEAEQANDAALHRFTEIASVEASLRSPVPTDSRTSIVDGYRTYNDYDQDYVQQLEEEEHQREHYRQQEQHATLMGGHVQTLGGTNLPIVPTSTASGVLPILSLGSVSSTTQNRTADDGNNGNNGNNGNEGHVDDHTYTGRSPVSKLYKDLNIQQDLVGIPSSISHPRPRSRGTGSPPRATRSNIPLLETVPTSSPGFIEHHMHYSAHGARRVPPHQYVRFSLLCKCLLFSSCTDFQEFFSNFQLSTGTRQWAIAWQVYYCCERKSWPKKFNKTRRRKNY